MSDELVGQSVGSGENITKPRFRGIPDLAGLFLLVPGSLWLVLSAPEGVATLAAGVYSFCACLTIAMSAAYHVPHWPERYLKPLQRADFSAIYFLIAGTYTPVCLLALGDVGRPMLIAAWSITAIGVAKVFFWPRAPRWLSTGVYLAFGWMVVPYIDLLWNNAGPRFVGLIALGGILYSMSALVYARRWGNIRPHIWGYHESMHLFVLAAVAVHFVAMWGLLIR